MIFNNPRFMVNRNHLPDHPYVILLSFAGPPLCNTVIIWLADQHTRQVVTLKLYCCLVVTVFQLSIVLVKIFILVIFVLFAHCTYNTQESEEIVLDSTLWC